MWGLGILAIVLLGALGKVITQTANLQKVIADQNTVFKTALTEEARNLDKSVYDQAIAVQKSLGDHNAALQRVEATLTERVRNLRQAPVAAPAFSSLLGPSLQRLLQSLDPSFLHAG